jgi:hypothetical protein
LLLNDSLRAIRNPFKNDSWIYIEEVGQLSAQSRHWMQFFSSVGKTVSFSENMCIGQTLIHFPHFIQVEVLRNTTLLPATIYEPLRRIGMLSEYPAIGFLQTNAKGCNFHRSFSENSLALNISRSFGLALL